MLWSLAILLFCEALGELAHALFALPVHSPVVGMALLLVGLYLFARLRLWRAPSLPEADGLLAYLPLFIVPPGVGAVMLRWYCLSGLRRSSAAPGPSPCPGRASRRRLVGVAAGVVVATSSVVAIAATLGAPAFLLLSIAPKSSIAAIAMAVAQQIGGDPSLAAGLAVLTGIFGAVVCTGLFDLIAVRDPRARLLATGVAAHGIGTARMLALDAEAGASPDLAWASPDSVLERRCRSQPAFCTYLLVRWPTV